MRVEGIGRREPRVFTIPPGAAFLPTLADALLDGTLAGPVATAELADVTIYLPTRRAGRALAAILAERAGARALLLPRIVPLGDADEDGAGPDGSALPPAVQPIERRLILTRLVQAWAKRVDRGLLKLGPGMPFLVPGSPADAVSLAGDLEALMDALATEDLDWDALAGIVEVEYSQYFRLTLDFVRIAHEHWPAILAERGAVDPARRRNAALEAEARRLLADRPAGPVVAAGSTGSIPATAKLLAAIARLPRGAVVLPGLDLDLDEAGWSAIGGRDTAGPGAGQGVHGHPQFLLRRLLETHLGAERSTVRRLGAGLEARETLLSEVMRPAETTDSWAAIPPDERERLAREGAKDICLIEAADEREEALAAAIALRETLAQPGRTAALVTPDRGLARRVAAELARWGVAVEDSAGQALSDTSAGRLARLAAEAAALDFEPARVLALLAHPRLRLGLTPADLARGRSALEIGVLRGPEPRPGLDGIADALRLRRRERSRRDPLARQRLTNEDWDLAEAVLRRLADAFAGFGHAHEPGGSSAEETASIALARAATPRGRRRRDRLPDSAQADLFEAELHAGPQDAERGIAGLRSDGGIDLVDLAAQHERVIAALEASPDGEQGVDPSGEALATLFDDLAATRVGDGRGASLLGRFAEYPAFFAALARDRTVPPENRSTHRRVKILGLLEARLLGADRVVLGGLDEAIWPPVAETDAFLNRPMRIGLGLSSPERRIGQTAHDFVQALGTRDAVITRARKRDHKPTVPSRFLERLRAFAGDGVWAEIRLRGDRYRRLAAALDRPSPVPPVRRPAPRPGGAKFPRRLSVTEIETLVRDPYAIYARHVLRLDPLDRIAVPPSLADRGTILHGILATFAGRFPAALPTNGEEVLLAIGADAFGPIADAYPELHALWWPAFARTVPAYLEWERERRAGFASLGVELAGSLAIPVAEGDEFTLAARADRIETGSAGEAAIVDFKSGTVPSNKVVAIGFSPQLTLEAAMLKGGGFPGAAGASSTPRLEYVKIGGRDTLVSCEFKPPRGDRRSVEEIVAAHLAGLTELVGRYARDDAGYRSRPYAQYAKRYAPYDHLARVAEWSLAGADPEEAET